MAQVSHVRWCTVNFVKAQNEGPLNYRLPSSTLDSADH